MKVRVSLDSGKSERLKMFGMACHFLEKKTKGSSGSKRGSMKLECPFAIYISTAKDEGGLWTIKKRNCIWYHDHILSTDPTIYHELRKPSGTQQLVMSALIEAKNRPSQVVNFMRKTDQTARINARDVSNFTAKYFSTSSV